MLIENDNRFHTPYLGVRLSVLDRHIQIRFNMYRKISRNENDNRFHSQNKYQIRLNGNDMEISLGIRLL